MQNIEPLEAEVVRVSTTKDGAFRVTLDLPNFNKKAGHYLTDKAVDNETFLFVIIDNTERQG